MAEKTPMPPDLWHPKTLVVKGFPEDQLDSSISILISYFEDKSKSGGGVLEYSPSFPGIVPAASGKEVLVVFKRQEDLGPVLEKKEHTVNIHGKHYKLVVRRCLTKFYEKYCKERLDDDVADKPPSYSSVTKERDQVEEVPSPHTANTQPAIDLSLTEHDTLTDESISLQAERSDKNEQIQSSSDPRPNQNKERPDVKPKTIKPQTLQAPKAKHGEEQSINKVVVSPTGNNLSADLLELYFESKKSSGGGPISSIELVDDAAILEFEFESDAAEVLSQSKHTINKQECTVTPFITQSKESSKESNNTIIITGFKPPLELEFVELWLESDKNGGGPLRRIELDESNMTVTVEFEHEAHAANMLKMRSATISGVSVMFSKPENLHEEDTEDELLSLVVTWPQQGPDIEQEILTLVLESEKKSGGGDLESIQFDESKRQAIVRFKDESVAKRVLNRQEVSLAGTPLKVQKLRKFKWDGHSVEVRGFSGKPNIEMISLLFESKRKSGGGPINEIIRNKSSVIIRFENKSDAERVLKKGSVELSGKTLTIAKPSQKDETTVDSERATHDEPTTEVIVLGIKQNITTEMLEMFFENEQKSGGGAVKQIRLDEEFGTAVITFESYKVARRVAAKERLSFMGQHLLVELKTDLHGSMHGRQLGTMTEVKNEENLKLKVTGILENTPPEFLSLFFESKRCDGGPIEDMEYDPDTGTALIAFKDKETLKKVMEKHKAQGLFLEKSQLCLKLVDVAQCAISLKGSCAIEVKGTPANCTDDMINLFFENRRRSGGGDIDEFWFLEDSVVITFKSNEVAERVYNQHRTSPLKMEHKLLEITHLRNKHRPKMLHDQTIVQQNALFLEDLPETAEVDHVINFLEKVPKCQVSEIWFGVSKGKAIAHFQIMPEYQQIYQHCCLKPLMGKLIGVQCVEKPKSIEVYNIGALSKQKLEMYFEHRRSGGGEIQAISLDEEDGNAIITFAKFGVAENVVNQKQHLLEKIKLVVGLHYECLGILPPHHDRSTPKGSIPEDLEIKAVDMDIIRFIEQTASNRNLVSDRLKSADAELIWPGKSAMDINAVFIHCTLTSQNATKAKKETWAENAKKSLEEVMGLYTADSINVLQEGWKEFRNQTGKLDQLDDNLMVQCDDDACTVTAIGKITAVSKTISDLTQTKYEVEGAIARKKKAISEEVKNLPAFKVKFVQAIKFPQRMKQTYPDAHIQCKDRKITIKGLPDEVLNIKLQMYELMNEIKSDTVKMSAAMSELLKVKKTRDFVIKQFQDRAIFMMFDVEQPGKVSVHARTPEDLTSGIAVLKSSIVEMNRDVKPENAQTIVAPGWHKFVNGLKEDYAGELMLDVTDSEIRLVCIRDISEGVMEMVVNYLEENTTLEQFIRMDGGTLKYLTSFKSKELDDIAKKFTATIKPTPDAERCGISVMGTSQVLKLTVPPIVELAKDIVECTHGINKPGMPKYFLSEHGQEYLESLEHKNKVVIITGEKATETVSLADFLSSTAPVALKPAKTKSQITLRSGHTVYVVEGDLTEYKVDAIVNAANESLEHVGGIAKAIVDKGGPSIQEECRRFIRQRGRMPTGGIFASESGKLPCKKIIHTVGPKWQTGYRGEDNQLYEAVFKTLEAVRKIGLNTVGLPAISSGVFGFPLSAACKTIVEAINDFAERDNSLTEIHLVDPSDKVVSQFHTEICAKYGKDKVALIDGKQERTKVGSTMPDVSVPRQVLPSKEPSLPSKPAWKKGPNPYSLITEENLMATSVEGEIAKQQVDVIVNTTSKDLNLNAGGVSASILRAAGPTIQQECQQSHPGGLSRGEIAKTGGGNINCKAIYHGSLPHWNDAKGDSILRQFMVTCLSTAHKSNMTSIAIPAIGTGNLGYPRDKVAAAMYDEVRKFSKTNPSTSLKDIRFLVYDKPTVQCFTAEISKLEQNLSPHPVGQARHGVRKLHKSPSSLEASLGAVGGASGMPRDRRAEHANPHKVLVIKDKVTIQVTQGDITEEGCDAIVNGTGSDLNFHSQVSRAILKKGGDSIKFQCERIKKTNKQGIAVTTAGNLKCKHIIHVAVPNSLDGSSVFQFSSKWSKRMDAIIGAAVESNCRSIAIPALGTGTLNLGNAELAETLIKAVADYCGKKKTGSLETVRFVIYQDQMVSTFQQQLEACAHKTKGFLRQMHDYFMGSSVDEPSFTVKDSDPVHTCRINFHIYASDQKSVDEVTKKIEMICDNESKLHVLDSPKDMEAIKELTPEQIESIKSLQHKHGVKIEVERHGRINKIVIEGQTEDTFAVASEINKLFREMEDNKMFESYAEVLHKQVQWAFDEGNGFEDYPPPISALIEKAYQDRKPEEEWPEEDESGQLRRCKVIFKDMIEIVDDDRSSAKPIKRKTPEQIEIPGHWSPMKKGEQFKVEPLATTDTEYKTVETKFTNSMNSGGSTFNSILSITRIQNPNLYQRYCVHKSHMEVSNPKGTRNERELWHGTAGDPLDEIHATGFNRGFCGVNGTAYGKGVYFATFASLSNGYAKPDASGHKHMYLSRVLTGEFTRGNNQLIVPPQKHPTNKTIKYDSVVDNESNPRIYVIFSDTQAYPEYLVKFQ